MELRKMFCTDIIARVALAIRLIGSVVPLRPFAVVVDKNAFASGCSSRAKVITTTRTSAHTYGRNRLFIAVISFVVHTYALFLSAQCMS